MAKGGNPAAAVQGILRQLAAQYFYIHKFVKDVKAAEVSVRSADSLSLRDVNRALIRKLKKFGRIIGIVERREYKAYEHFSNDFSCIKAVAGRFEAIRAISELNNHIDKLFTIQEQLVVKLSLHSPFVRTELHKLENHHVSLEHQESGFTKEQMERVFLELESDFSELEKWVAGAQKLLKDISFDISEVSLEVNQHLARFLASHEGYSLEAGESDMMRFEFYVHFAVLFLRRNDDKKNLISNANFAGAVKLATVSHREDLVTELNHGFPQFKKRHAAAVKSAGNIVDHSEGFAQAFGLQYRYNVEMQTNAKLNMRRGAVRVLDLLQTHCKEHEDAIRVYLDKVNSLMAECQRNLVMMGLLSLNLPEFKNKRIFYQLLRLQKTLEWFLEFSKDSPKYNLFSFSYDGMSGDGSCFDLISPKIRGSPEVDFSSIGFFAYAKLCAVLNELLPKIRSNLREYNLTVDQRSGLTWTGMEDFF